jgi:rfaE bifunctional protein nucleotidyltransferase chain/domain
MQVWVNGTFDILHIGHLELFSYASTFGKLRVGIDSDSRVRKLKGYNRPINNQENRKKFLESIKFIDSVVVFNDDTELINNIKDWNTEIFVIGSDYMNKKIIGSEFCKQVIFFDRLLEFSTTKIIERCSKLP